jgi:hypothetical protein
MPWPCVPAAFRPPAFASQPSFPARGSRPSYDRPASADAPDPDGVSAFRTHEIRPDRAPSLPRDQRCSRRPGAIPGPPPAAPQRRRPCTPAPVRHLSGAMPHETSIKGSRRSPARPSPHPWPPDDTGNPPAFPRASHPHGQDPRTHARAGTGSEHKPGTTLLAYMPALQSASSLASCATSRRTYMGTSVRRCRTGSCGRGRRARRAGGRS